MESVALDSAVSGGSGTADRNTKGASVTAYTAPVAITSRIGCGHDVIRLRYRNVSFDVGAKYRGFSFQSEFTYRILSDFEANGPLPDSEIHDRSVFAEAGHMIVPKKLMLYGATSYVWDQYKRNPWEATGGLSFYPYGRRNLRLNLHYIHVEKSSAGSNFGYYAAGQTGNTIALNTDILL